MRTVDRSVAIIRPKRLYVEWANACSHEERNFAPEYFENFHSIALLIPAYDSITTNASRKYVASLWKEIFTMALERWNEDRKAWPKGISSTMLGKWFKIEFVRTVADSIK